MKVKVTVKGINVIDFDENGNTTLRIRTKEKYQGIRRQDDGTYVQCEDCDVINMSLRAATAMLCNCNDDIAVYRSCQAHSLTQRQLALLLIDAKLDIERQFVAAGEVIATPDNNEEEYVPQSEYVAEFDMFTTRILGVTLSAKAQHRLDDALAL